MLLIYLDEYYCSRYLCRESLKTNGYNAVNYNYHSKWSRKYHPFILYKCKRSKAIANYSAHEYKIINAKDHFKYYEKSKSKFERKYNKEYSKENTEKYHE